MFDHLLTHLHDDPASRIRAVEEREISALASHADTVNTYRIERRRDNEPPLYWWQTKDGRFSAWMAFSDTATIFSEAERQGALMQAVRGERPLLPFGGVWVLLQTSTLECHGCGDVQTLNRSAREVAEKAYAEDYMVHRGNVLCRECQER